MANLTLNPDGADVWGKTEMRFYTLQPTAADYVPGGYPLTPGVNVSLRTITGVLVVGGGGGYDTQWNPATGKLQVFSTNITTGLPNEVANGTDLSAVYFSLQVYGN